MDLVTEICDQDNVLWNEWIYKPGDQPCALLIRNNLHAERQCDRPSEGFAQLIESNGDKELITWTVSCLASSAPACVPT